MANRYAVETAFNLIDKATGPLAKIGVKGSNVGKKLKKDFMKAQDQLAGLGRAARKAGMAVAAAGVAAVGAFAVQGVRNAIAFNREITKIATVADLSNISLEELSNQIMDVSNRTGVAASRLANYQYQVINSGINTADSSAFVAAAVRTSIAAFEDAGTVITGLTKVMNAYQLEASEAERVANQMYIATTVGNASFRELNSSLGRVLPTAARLNIGTDELFASIAALTANAIETPKAMKGIDRILQAVQNPTERMLRASRRLGIEFSAAAIESKGLAGFLQEIQDRTGGCERYIMALFESVESLNAINILTSRGAETFAEAMAQMQDATGAVDRAFNTVMESPAERWGRVMNRIRNAGIDLGTALLPIVERVMIKIEGFANKLGAIDFEPIANKVSRAFDRMARFISPIMGLIGLLWRLRFVIIGVAAPMLVYKGLMTAAAAAFNVWATAKKIGKGVMLAFTLLTNNQTKAMALYQKGSMGAGVATALFTVRQKAAAAASIFFNTILSKQGPAFLAAKTKMGLLTAKTIVFSKAKKAAAFAGKSLITTFKLLKAAILLLKSPIALKIAALVTLVSIIKEVIRNAGAIGQAFKMDGIIAGFQKLSAVILSGALAPIQSLLEMLARIPGVSRFLGPAVERVQNFREGLTGMGVEADVVQNVVPAEIKNIVPAEVTNIVPSAITQTATTTAGIPSNTAPNINTASNQTITAATAPATRPMTTAEQYIYNQSVSREEVDIAVRAEQGTQARVTRPPRSPNVRVTASGGNYG